MRYRNLLTTLIALAGLPAVFAQSPALTYIPNSSVKLYQVNGDCDWAVWDATITNKTPTCKPTVSQTATKADVLGDDVPVVFENNGEMIVTFGDTIGADPTYYPKWVGFENTFQWNSHDPIARSTTANASDGLLLNFFMNGNHGLEVLPPPQPNGTPVDMGADNVPSAGVSVNGQIYLGVTTGSVMVATGDIDRSNDYSVLTTFDENTAAFTSGRTLSALPNGNFVRPVFYLAAPGVLGTLPPVSPEPVMVIFGVGPTAKNVYLSIIPSTEFWSGTDQNGNASTRYFAGMSQGRPTWSSSEANAAPLLTGLGPSNPTIPYVTIFYSQPLGLWLMMFESAGTSPTSGMYFTYASRPWGPWSAPQLVFNACRDRGFGNFMFYYYAAADENDCPSAMPAGVTSAPNSAGPAGPTAGDQTKNVPTTTRGIPYGPAFVERFTVLSGNTLKLFYLMSTWNPYAVMLMESDFNIADGPALLSGTLANGASYVPGGLVPGSWAQVKGTNLSNTTRIWAASDFTGLSNNLPTNLSGVQVMVDNLPAAVYYISPTQVNFQVPTGITGTASVEVINNSVASNSVTAPAATNSPAIFPNILNGTNYAAGVFYSDGLYVGDPSIGPAFRNAKPGDIIQLYATGLVPTPGGVLPLFQTVSGVTVTIGSITVPASAAGLVAVGEFQINFTVPQQFASMPAGNYPLTIAVDGISSPATIDSSPPAAVVLPIQH